MAKGPNQSGAAPAEGASNRRGFFVSAWAVLVGGLLALVPAAAALAVILDPLRRRSKEGQFLRVATLDVVPEDGVPRQFPVIAARVDAWNESVQPVGAVFLRRLPDQEVPECLTAVCPHAGCLVPFDRATGKFKCPCHNSSFAVDGAIIPPSPSPRPMDTLECKVEGNDVLVKYENFYSGMAEKIVKQ